MKLLLPAWRNAAPDATHYVIHADGAAEWLHVLGGGEVRIDDEAHCWSHDDALWWESAGHVPVPPGVDWRQCCWERNE